jgi:AcrR family transcriptional regulator
VRTKTPLQAEKILTAAAQLFARHRFHEARMDDIAALAGVGKGTLYRYFKDKEELYLALLEQAGEQYPALLQAAVDGAEGARPKLAALVGAILAYFDSHPHLFDLIQHAEAMMRPGGVFPWQAARDQVLRLVYEVFDEGQREGAFVIRDRELGMLMLLGGLRAVLRFSTEPKPPDLARRLVEDFLHGHAQQAGACGMWTA